MLSLHLSEEWVMGGSGMICLVMERGSFDSQREILETLRPGISHTFRDGQVLWVAGLQSAVASFDDDGTLTVISGSKTVVLRDVREFHRDGREIITSDGRVETRPVFSEEAIQCQS